MSSLSYLLNLKDRYKTKQIDDIFSGFFYKPYRMVWQNSTWEEILIFVKKVRLISVCLKEKMIRMILQTNQLTGWPVTNLPPIQQQFLVHVNSFLVVSSQVVHRGETQLVFWYITQRCVGLHQRFLVA